MEPLETVSHHEDYFFLRKASLILYNISPQTLTALVISQNLYPAGHQCTRLPSCADNHCFGGVECRDGPNGPQCGPCPRGYEGDGRTCTRRVCNFENCLTCADNPCFSGVTCRDTARGAECGQCPRGYEGDGRTCIRRNPCEYNRCAPGMSPYGP